MGWLLRRSATAKIADDSTASAAAAAANPGDVRPAPGRTMIA